MTGSQTPQRAIRRLALLGGRSERLGSALASSPLLDDPIAILTGVSLDESTLEAVLLRLEGNAAGSTAAAAAARPRGSIAARRARRRTSPTARALRAEAAELPVDVRHRPLPASRQPVRLPRVRVSAPALELEPPARSRRAAAATRAAGAQAPGSPSATSPLARAARTSPTARALRAEAAELPVDVRHRPLPASRQPVPLPRVRVSAPALGLEPPARSSRAAAAARAGSRAPGSPSATSPLAPAAARVPGGAAAVMTPISAEWTDAEPVAAEWAAAEPEPVGVANAPALLQAVLARAGTEPGGTAELPNGRPGLSEPADRLPHRPSLADALVPARIAARLPAEPSTFPAIAEGAEVDEVPLPAGSSSGLAALVRRWEATHGRDRDDDPAGVRLESGGDAVAGIEAESALARAVERLLAAELRRSGIEVDVG